MISKYVNILSHIPNLFRIIFCVYMIGTLGVLLFIDQRIQYASKNSYLKLPNIVLIIFVLILFVLSIKWILSKGFNRQKSIRLTDKGFYIVIGIFFLIVFMLQFFISSRINFETGWDARLITSNSLNIAFNGATGVDIGYYSYYPNNLTLTYLLAYLYKLGSVFSIENPKLTVLFITNLLVNLSVLLATMCVYKITKSRNATYISMLIGLLLIALSPWIIISYSDSLGMIFPVVAIFFYLFIPNNYLRYSLLILSCLIGYLVKPTVIIVLIAVAMIKVISFLIMCLSKRISIKKVASGIAAFLTALVLFAGFNVFIQNQNKTLLDENKNMTWTHFLMMGLNTERNGVYYEPDIAFSQSFPDIASRQKANLNEVGNRLKQLGVLNYMKLLLQKNLTTYNDGTFSWGGEGSFYASVPEPPDDAAKALRSFYYTNETGTNYGVFATIEQTLWLFVLLSIAFCILPRKNVNDTENIVALALLGVSIFFLLFECRARYLYIFSPLFLILAGSGLYRMAEWLQNRRNGKNKSRSFIKVNTKRYKTWEHSLAVPFDR